MKTPLSLSRLLLATGIASLAATGLAQTTPAATPSAAASPVPAAAPAPSSGPYKVVNSAKVGGDGGFDYVYADSDGRKLYVPRGNRVVVYDLDTLKQAGEIPQTNGVHGAAVDPKTHHGFCSSNPVVMWDTQTLQTIKTIPVQGRPDGILFEPATERVYILSHSQPNVTAIDAKDGSIVGTVDLGGAPEQAASDGQGHVYIDLEDKDSIAVVDANALKLTGTYDLAGKGGGPGGLAMDVKNRILFSACHDPQTMVILNADTGKILAALPIGRGTDGATFNPNTLEAFSSQGDGTLTVIKENSPTDFVVEQNVQTKTGAKTCTLDTTTNQIYLITAERAPAPPPAAAAVAAPAAGATAPAATAAPALAPAASTQVAASPAPAAPGQPGVPGQPGGEGQGRRGGRGGRMVPGSFTILVVGK